MTDTLVKTSGDTMVVSFQSAKSPSVWRVKLSQLDGASFKVDGGKSKYVLLFDKNGTSDVLAEYTTKSAATDALNEISKVMFDLEAEPVAVVTTHSPKAIENDDAIADTSSHPMTFWRRVYWVAFAVLFVGFTLFILSGSMTPPQDMTPEELQTSPYLPDRPNSQTMGGDLEDLPDIQQGRPVPADEFFGE